MPRLRFRPWAYTPPGPPPGDDGFSQENSLPGGGWQTVTELGWPSPRVLPQATLYQDDDGSGLYDYNTDWFPNCKHRLTAPVTTSDTVLPISGPPSTTVAGAHSAGGVFLSVASTAGWDQSHQFEIAGHANPYWVSAVMSATQLRISRGLDAPVSNGAAVTYRSGFAVGQDILVLDKPTGWAGLGGWSYAERRTITAILSEYSLQIGTPLSEGRPSNARVSRDWLGLADIVSDPTYPGANQNVLRQRLPQGFHGGYYPSKVGKHPQYVGNRLTWAQGLTTGYVYMAGMLRWVPSGFTHGRNRGTKWIYLGSDNPGTRYINLQLTAQANAGATSISVNDDGYYITFLAAGGQLRLGGPSGELVVIQSRAGTTVTLTAPLAQTHLAGAQVYRPGNLAHITASFGRAYDDPLGPESTTQMAPNYTPQFQPDTFNDVASPAYDAPFAEMPNDGGWHKLEILQEPGTPGVANWRVRTWINGNLSYDDTGLQLILLEQAIDFNVLEFLPVYGGGLQSVPVDQEVRTGRFIVKVR